MKRKSLLLKLLVFSFFFSIYSCKKSDTLQTVHSDKKNVNTVIPYNFDWETLDYMPTPSNVVIPVPWGSSSTRAFPLSFGADIKKADGWELVYNTFSPTKFEQPAFFILYNRYRGLMKGFFYLSPGSAIPSSYVSHSLVQTTGGNDAKVFSYSGSEFTNIDTNNNVTTLIQPFRTSATGTWYAQEYEMAYDPNVGTKNAATNLMSWAINSVNVSDIKLDGTSQGTIKGTIATPIPPTNLLGTLFHTALQVYGLSSLTTSGLKDPVTKALESSITSGLQGNIKNVSNAIFSSLTGGGSGPGMSNQYVNLTSTTNYKLTGSETNVYELANPSMVIPGSLGQENTSLYSPLYTKPMGIMSLSGSPTASFKTVMGRDGLDVYDLTFNPNDYSIQWNPSIINTSQSGASIANIKSQILCFEDYYDNNYTDVVVPFTHPNVERGSKPFYNDAWQANNKIAFRAYFSGSSEGNSYSITWTPMTVGKPLPVHVLRISFDVIPNNGAAKVTIVKSFRIILKDWDAS